MVARRWVRNFIIVGIVLASFASALAIAYELALARVPKHRAAMENLVRAQTGLDIRFNELALRWGWYGPEAVFRRVELGEPGRSNVLLRAPQLIVAINAWQTARSGRLVAGRITLISPDIDLERLTRAPRTDAAPSRPAPEGSVPGLPPSRPAIEGLQVRSKILDRWKGGVIDLQGGTIRLPDPTNTASALTLQIRRAALRRADSEWSGHALVFLPERLGRTARVVMQLKGDINALDTLSGGIRFEGVRLSFSSWRGVLADVPKLASNLPLSGAGDVTVDLTLKDGRVQKADGRARAVDLAIGAPSWLGAVSSTRSVLKLDYLTGDWRYARRAESSQLQIEQLVLSREQKDSPLPAFSIEMNAGHVRGSLPSAPLRSLSAIAHWLAPELAPDAVALEGNVEDVEVDWNPRRPEGFRLAASAKVDEALATSVTHGFSVKGLPVRLQATESRVGIEIDAPTAYLKLAADPEWPAQSIALTARAFIERANDGWRLTIPRFGFHDEALAGNLSGTVTADASDATPVLDLRGSLFRADVARVQELFADGVTRVLGGASLRLANGRIENGSFEWTGPANEPATRRFTGSFDLRGGRFPADDLWPEANGLDARVEWNGSRVRAKLARGQAGGFDLESVEAQWDVAGDVAGDAAGEQPAHFTGRAHGRFEKALAWLRTHPELQKHAPHLQDLVASGDAMFDFDVSVPAVEAQPLRARVSTVLEGAQFKLAPDLPPVEALRGSIAFDSGKLQRSTLSATWLGGPLTLRIGERRDRKGVSVVVQAQGYVDARKLVALSEVRNLAEVSGETAWSGEFFYTPPSDSAPARWQGRADSTLIGVSSELSPPLAKTANSLLPLHVEIIGTGDRSELRANLSDRLRAAFALNVVNREDWHIDRGAIRLGGGAATLPSDETIQVRGHVKRLDAPAYMVAWQQLRKGAPDTHADIDLTADELAFGDRVYLDATVQADATTIQIQAPALGTFSGTLMAGAKEVVFSDLHLKKEALTGTGTLRCSTDLSSCASKFELNTHDTAATLVDLGFRGDLSAATGTLSGEISWQPRKEGPWLASATGTLSMRFEDGTAHRPDRTAIARPFPLLAVPELLGGIGGPGSRDIAFKRLDATFALHEGQATTADLHFDGDAEILLRGRVGLLARDYDYEAWVLRGEERIPASVRRLPSAPRVAAAWLSLRELVGGESVNRSRTVFRLRGTWSDPEVTSE
jgi:uncharacterized protein YhdP